MLDQILPAEDKDVVRVVERAFKKQGITMLTGTKVEGVEAGDKSVKLKAGDQDLEVDYLVIAGGRGADVEPLEPGRRSGSSSRTGRSRSTRARRPPRDGIYAIGDITPGPALAHKAQEEGVVAMETIAGAKTHAVDLDDVPGATFCHPQVASVGLTEAAAKEAGHDVKVGKFKLGGVGAGAVYDDRDGMVKIVADKKYGEILGAHIVGNRACDMIAELVAVKELEGGVPGAGPDHPPAPDDLRGDPRRRPRRRRLGDARLGRLLLATREPRRAERVT